ncbi:MAG: hypothetical protein ACTSPB_18865 [Candidatus Thorarchaeota archaeon]
MEGMALFTEEEVQEIVDEWLESHGYTNELDPDDVGDTNQGGMSHGESIKRLWIDHIVYMAMNEAIHEPDTEVSGIIMLDSTKNEQGDIDIHIRIQNV